MHNKTMKPPISIRYVDILPVYRSFLLPGTTVLFQTLHLGKVTKVRLLLKTTENLGLVKKKGVFSKIISTIPSGHRRVLPDIT